jgi:hypothetical protein
LTLTLLPFGDATRIVVKNDCITAKDVSVNEANTNSERHDGSTPSCTCARCNTNVGFYFQFDEVCQHQLDLTYSLIYRTKDINFAFQHYANIWQPPKI